MVPPWHAFRTGNGMPNVPVEIFNLKQVFITGKVLSEAGRPQQKVFHHPTDTVVRQRDLCGKSSCHTRVGSQALFDRFRVFAGLRTTLICVQLLRGKKRIQLRLPILEPQPCQLATRCWRTNFQRYQRDTSWRVVEDFLAGVVLGERCRHSGGTFH